VLSAVDGNTVSTLDLFRELGARLGNALFWLYNISASQAVVSAGARGKPIQESSKQTTKQSQRSIMKLNRSGIVVTLACVSLLAGSSASAQTTNRPTIRPAVAAKGRHGAMGPLEMMKQSLNLSDDQVQKLEPVLKEHRDKINALRRDNSLSREERVAKVKEIGGMSDSKVKALLTPDQVQKWQNSRTNLQQVMRQKPTTGTNQVITAEKVAAWQRLNSSRQVLPQRQEPAKSNP
jgi:Spy/CpxP family protein refolding chaperone